MEKIEYEHFTVIDTFKKLQGIKNPRNTTFYKCRCNCGTIFEVRSDRLKKVRACKKCTITLRTKDKGGLYSEIPNFSVLRRKYKGYEKRAREKGQDFEVSIEEAIELFQGNCHYCGIEPQEIEAIYKGNTIDGVCKANSIDRIDSSKGYVKGNMVSCCNICNTAKLNQSEINFLDWVNRVYTYQSKKSSTTIPHEGSTL